jgi:hypothetical protein
MLYNYFAATENLSNTTDRLHVCLLHSDLCCVFDYILFRTMRSRDHDVVVVRRTINLGLLGIWNEEGMGRERERVGLRVT